MANLRGLVDSMEVLQNLRETDWSGIFMRYVNQFPLPYLLNRYGKEKVTDPKFEMYEDELLPDTCQVNGALPLTSETSVVLDDSSMIPVGALLHNPIGGEIMRVTANNGTTTVTVVRGQGSSTAAAIADNQVLFILGTSFAEGTSPAAAVTTKTETVYNYCQIFKKTINLTKTLQATSTKGGDWEKRKLLQAEMEFMRDMNYALQFGSRSSSESNQRLTGGLLQFITTNVTDNSAAALTQSAVDLWLQNCFAFTTDRAVQRKVVIGSPLFTRCVTNFANGKLQVQQVKSPDGKTQFGLNVIKYISPSGVVDIVEDKLLKGTTYGAWAWCLDIDQVKYKYLRDVTMNRNLPTEDDAVKHELIAEAGLGLVNEKSHGILKNFVFS